MLTALTFDEVQQRLGHAFQYRYKDVAGRPVRLVGLLFARPESPLSKAEVVPNLDYYYQRSGDHIDFFCAGYALGPEQDSQHDRVRGSRGDFWVFNAGCFDSVRRAIESQTRWQYSGGTDLLLANATADASGKRGVLDFRSTIVCQLDTMKTDKAIQSVEMFFEDIIRFAESASALDPAWGFSDKMGRDVGLSVLQRVILSLLPKSIGDEAERAAHFAVRNVSTR